MNSLVHAACTIHFMDTRMIEPIKTDAEFKARKIFLEAMKDNKEITNSQFGELMLFSTAEMMVAKKKENDFRTNFILDLAKTRGDEQHRVAMGLASFDMVVISMEKGATFKDLLEKTLKHNKNKAYATQEAK